MYYSSYNHIFKNKNKTNHPAIIVGAVGSTSGRRMRNWRRRGVSGGIISIIISGSGYRSMMIL